MSVTASGAGGFSALLLLYNDRIHMLPDVFHCHPLKRAQPPSSSSVQLNVLVMLMGNHAE